MPRHLRLIFLIFVFSPIAAFAAEESALKAKREVRLELEEVVDATLYEIELTSKSTGLVQKFKMKNPVWKAAIRPGEYAIRLRSYDQRNVPGQWSPSSPFIVRLAGPDLLKPKNNSIIESDHDIEHEIQLAWQAVPHTDKYRVDILDENGKVYKTEFFTKNNGKVVLPVARQYQWTVTPISKSGQDGEGQDSPGRFAVKGKKLSPPEIDPPEDIWVEKLKWKPTEFSENCSYLLQYKTKQGKWKLVDKNGKITSNEIPFPAQYPGGQYRLVVRSNATLRDSSKISQITFDVADGDRSPSAVQEAKLRYSLEKPTPWYFIASYLVTQVQYSGTNRDADQSVVYDSFGGTGRLGLGYIHPETKSGYLGMIDMSGITVDNTNVTYSSAEAHYVRRWTWGRSMFRPSAGLFYKELVEAYNTATQPTLYTQQKLSYAGPHIGFDYWHPLTSRLGYQINMRVYYSAVGLKSPNGEEQSPELSYLLGVMGSYRIRPHITGLAGWAYKLDQASYGSTPTGTNSSIAPAGASQNIKIEGNYLNLILEWAF